MEFSAALQSASVAFGGVALRTESGPLEVRAAAEFGVVDAVGFNAVGSAEGAFGVGAVGFGGLESGAAVALDAGVFGAVVEFGGMEFGAIESAGPLDTFTV